MEISRTINSLDNYLTLVMEFIEQRMRRNELNDEDFRKVLTHIYNEGYRDGIIDKELSKTNKE